MSWAVAGVPADAAHAAGREVIVFVVGWLVFVEVTHRLAPLIGRAERWGRFIAVWNWCNVVEGVLVIVGGIPGTLGAPADRRSGVRTGHDRLGALAGMVCHAAGVRGRRR